MSDEHEHPDEAAALSPRERAIVHETCMELVDHASSISGADGLSVDDVAVLPDGRLGLFERDGDRVWYFATDVRTGDEVVVEASPWYVRSVDPGTGETVAELILPGRGDDEPAEAA
jgi:hypothetical protein